MIDHEIDLVLLVLDMTFFCWPSAFPYVSGFWPVFAVMEYTVWLHSKSFPVEKNRQASDCESPCHLAQ